MRNSSSEQEEEEVEEEEDLGMPGPVKKRCANANHRLSGFDRAWLRKHPWLLFDREKKAMFCKLCTKYDKLPRNGTGKWVTSGATSFRHDKLMLHERSRSHRDAKRARVEESRAQATGGIRAALEEAASHERRAVIGALKCMYYLAKNELPHTTNFSGLISLAISLGCNYMKDLNQGGNASYQSERTISEFVEVISDCIKQEVMNRMSTSDSISLMIDESTDVSILKQLVIYGRGVVKGELQCHFLGIRDLFNGQAVTIEKATLEFLQENNMDISQVSSFGSDGASVMTGRHEGVAARLRRLNGSIISIHCVAHRLALATSQASSNVPYLSRFKELLSNLFYFYHNSSVRQSGLTAIQQVLGDPILRLKQAKDVRWLSHQAAVDALRRTLPSVLTSLEREAAERGEPTACGLVRLMRKFFFVASLSLFADVLPHLCKLSKIMQSSSLDFTILQPVVDSCVRCIEQQQTTPGSYLSHVDDLISKLGDSGHHINVSDSERNSFDAQVRQPYLAALIKNLHDRFPAMQIISSFSIFDPTHLPCNEDDQSQYGVVELGVLLDHYSSGPLALHPEAAYEEWKEFKVFLSQSHFSNMKELTKFLLCTPEREQMFPTISKLLVRGLVLPIATADCERGFSAMNRIKTTPRNRLKTETLEQLMFISIEGPPASKYDFARAANTWGSRGNRRIHWQS